MPRRFINSASVRGSAEVAFVRHRPLNDPDHRTRYRCARASFWLTSVCHVRVSSGHMLLM